MPETKGSTGSAMKYIKSAARAGMKKYIKWTWWGYEADRVSGPGNCLVLIKLMINDANRKTNNLRKKQQWNDINFPTKEISEIGT